MRLGMPVLDTYETPEQWIAILQRAGCRAAYWPLADDAGQDVVSAYVKAAQDADILIAEVGAWSNPLSPDEATRQNALSLCQKRLALAEEVGARCCTNIAGSRGTQWDGPHPDNLTEETFDMIVEGVRTIIDAVNPTRTFYTLETMPWIFPDSVDSYLRLVRAIDRPQFAVHLDPVNLISSPQRFYSNKALLRECFEKLGPWIKSCHAKDIALRGTLTTHLDEVRPGLGGLDYTVYLQELARLDPDMPLMLEHLETQQDYLLAANYIQSITIIQGEE